MKSICFTHLFDKSFIPTLKKRNEFGEKLEYLLNIYEQITHYFEYFTTLYNVHKQVGVRLSQCNILLIYTFLLASLSAASSCLAAF